MRRCFGLFLVIGSLAVCGVACSADPGGGSGGSAALGGVGGGVGGVGGVGGGGTGGAGGSLCNGQTTRPCYCTDGSMRTQFCNEAAHTLTMCDCPIAQGGDGGAGGGPTALCERLLGMSNCDSEPFYSPKLPASLLFLVDRSGSMLCNPPPTQTTEECETGMLAATTKDTTMPTKWDLTSDALRAAFDALAATGGAKAGLTLFNNNDACGVSSTPSVPIADLTAQHASALADALDRVEPRGATPIVGGTLLAYQHLHWEATAGCQTPPCGAPGNRFVVLLTDGADTCPSEDLPNHRQALLMTEVQKARMANIRTFVIGAPGSEPARGFLSELAFQGGTARDEAGCMHPNIDGDVGNCHFDLASSTDLATDLQIALGDISGAALTCEFTVPGGAGPDVNVQYTLSDAAGPICVSKLPDGAACDTTTDGWVFARTAAGAIDNTKVVLCGPACESVKADVEARVDVVLGCNPLE